MKTDISNLSVSIKEFGDNIAQLNELYIEALHRNYRHENNLLMKQVEDQLINPNISDKQKDYARQILNNLKSAE